MNLQEALQQTAPRKGPSSTIDKLLDAVNGPERDAIVNALNDGKIQQTHLGRALTLVARDHGVIGSTSSITGQAVGKWRDANEPR